MTRWKLTIEYDGTGFCGWQKQKHALGVQQVIEEAILRFSGEPAELCVAGRTDTGVHASGQVAHFDLEKETDGATVRDAINFYLRPHAVAILDAEQVEPSFHARFDAQDRRYSYLIETRRAPLALQANRAWHIPYPLTLEPMQEAAQLLLGKHDFSTFRASGCQASSPLRTLDELTLTQQGSQIIITTRARSFLYHQVRNMAGTLSLVGADKWSLDDFAAAFAACDRRAGGPTAPAAGLTFVSVTY